MFLFLLVLPKPEVSYPRQCKGNYGLKTQVFIILIKESVFFWSWATVFSSFSFPSFVGIELGDPTDILLPHFPKAYPSSVTYGPGREGSAGLGAGVLMNSFQTACCQSHLLQRPGVEKRIRRLCPGVGGRERAEGGRFRQGPASSLGTPRRTEQNSVLPLFLRPTARLWIPPPTTNPPQLLL